MATMADSAARAVVPREPPGRVAVRQAYTPEYQELKFTLHRKLLDRINLEALSSMGGERVRTEIRTALAKLID